MMSAFFHFRRTLNRLFNNCITFYWSWISSSWNMKGVSNWPTASALSHQDPISLLCLLSLSFLHCFSSFFTSDKYNYHRNDFFCLILRCIIRTTCLGIVIEIYFLCFVNLIEFIDFCSFFTLVYLSFGFNPKTAVVGWGGGGQFDPPGGISKNVSSRWRVKPWFFVTFNYLKTHLSWKFHWISSSCWKFCVYIS